ncbi:MAG TPA: class I SAM-dependent methyltransferase [Solirubrobacteraceae bacterium]|nr:class I SAM-dependent methyltransferase [Solirubrobacteraceae bacterium]
MNGLRARMRRNLRGAVDSANKGGRRSWGARATPPSWDFSRELGPKEFASERGAVTERLYARLDPADIAEVERRTAEAPELSGANLGDADPASFRFLVLSYGIWLDVPGVAEKTGLVRGQPPAEVHAMTRGPDAAAGGLYEADLLVEALASAGLDIEVIESGLDFGCSSGRVVRTLAAAYPSVSWRGCDPNEPAITWAQQNLPGIGFFVSPQHPPLPLSEGSLDLVYAVSVWSHFAPGLGLRWFEEMHRLIRPGGHLVFTTHGLQSIAVHSAAGFRSPDKALEITHSLYASGAWYAPEFGAAGDWGVADPEWGTSFLSPEWVLTKLCPSWRVLEFAPGRNQGFQDVYVLQRA